MPLVHLQVSVEAAFADVAAEQGQGGDAVPVSPYATKVDSNDWMVRGLVHAWSFYKVSLMKNVEA